MYDENKQSNTELTENTDVNIENSSFSEEADIPAEENEAVENIDGAVDEINEITDSVEEKVEEETAEIAEELEATEETLTEEIETENKEDSEPSDGEKISAADEAVVDGEQENADATQTESSENAENAEAVSDENATEAEASENAEVSENAEASEAPVAPKKEKKDFVAGFKSAMSKFFAAVLSIGSKSADKAVASSEFMKKELKGCTRIKYRILRLVSISVCLAVVIVTVVSIISTIQTSEKSYKEQAEALSTAYMQNFNTKLEALTMELNGVKSNSGMLSVTDESLIIGTRVSKLAEIANATMFKDLILSDKNGDTLNEVNIADYAHFQAALEGKNTLSSPLMRRTTGNIQEIEELIFQLAVRYRGMTYDGVLIGCVEPSFFSDGLETISTDGNKNNVVILDADGNVVAASNLGLVTGGVNYLESADGGLKSLAETMIKGEHGTMKYTSGGVEYLAAYQPIELTTGWTIAVSLDYSAVSGSVWSTVLIIALIGIAIIIVTILISIVVANHISGPITVVAERLHRLSDGDINSTFGLKAPNDETKILTNSLTNTIDQLGLYIHDIEYVLANIADGNLTTYSSIEYKGDFIAIGDSLTKITSSLNDSINTVKDSVENLSSGSSQVAEGSKTISDSAIKQAEAVSEIVTTIGSIRDKADHTANISNEILGITNKAGESAHNGAALMEELVEAIKNINEKSDKIREVIQTIDSIAFQTNILAINAAIEAARAGEVGRGFSVVADEVANLANMSAEAVKQTEVLINDTVEAVNVGTTIAGKAEIAINSIVTDVNMVAGHMQQIVTAANEQNVAVEQITAGIDRIDEGMHSASATAQESAASSEELSQLAISLTHEMDKFVTERRAVEDTDDEYDEYDEYEEYEEYDEYEEAEE